VTLVSEDRQRVGHAIDGIGEGRDFTLRFDGEPLAEVAVGHGGNDLHDAANLFVRLLAITFDVVGQVLPRYRPTPGTTSLTTQLAFGTDFARKPCHLGREAVELVDHRVDGLLQLQTSRPSRPL